MKIIITLALVFMSCLAYADFNQPPATALEWYLRNLNKIPGASVCTQQQPDGKWKITKWVVDGVSEPTAQEVLQIISDYEAQLKPDISYEALLISINKKFTGMSAIKLAPYLGAIEGYVKAKNYSDLKTFALGLIQANILTQDEYNLFNSALKEQGIDLDA